MIYQELFLRMLFFTILTETACLFIITRKLFNIDKSLTPNSKIMFSGFIASFGTLPYLWFVLPWVIKDRLIFVIVGEIAVVLIEAMIYYFMLQLKPKRALIASILCNLASYALVFVLY